MTLSEVQYGNGDKVKYAYDGFDRLTEVKYDAETAPRYEYKYGANGEATEVVDHELNRTARTDYDQADRPCQTELRDDATGEALYKTNLKYNKLNQLEMFSEQAGGETHKTEFAYDRDNRVTGITYDGSAHKVNYTYDELGRVASRAAECGADAGKLTSTYEYVDGGYGTNSTTPLVKKITQNGISFEYEYDSRGNITSEKRGDLTTTYQYDAPGQLIRVNDPHENTTWVYNYDRGGNILSKVKYAYTTGAVGTAVETIPYVYGDSNWKDKLTSYNGQTITYDAIGNPLNDGTWTYTWQAGRQLKQMSAEGTNVSFKYDHNGMRVQKVVEQSWYPEIISYTYHRKLLTHMTVNYTDWNEIARQDKLHFFYDGQSRPAKVEFNGTVYTYLPNLQGDIIGMLDSSGALVVEYKYDAWGKPLSTTGILADTLGKRNPFRYRGYVYDEETELYYLRSRYYNSQSGRFVNADAYITTGCGINNGNPFIYCNNTPASLIDPDGTRFWSTVKALVSAAYAIVRSIIGYDSADAAAKAFSQRTYSQSRYIRHEYGTQIYTREIFGVTRYYYATPVVGEPHSVIPGQATVPEGATIVAVAHTHPNSNSFSSSDQNYAIARAIDIYVVGPDLNVQKYDHFLQETTIVGTICLVTLSDEQKEQLRADYQTSWDDHIAAGDANGFDCSSIPWPTE